MEKNNFQLIYGFSGNLVLFIFVLMQPWICQAEKSGFKAKHDEYKKETAITLDIATPEYELAEEGEWTILNCKTIEIGRFLQKGEPDLLSLTYFVSIPQDAKVKHISIKPCLKEINLIKHLKPVLEPVIIGEPPKSPVPDERIYGCLKPYPDKDYDYEIVKQGSTTLLVLTVYPFKYIGMTKSLLVTEYMEVSIVLTAKDWKPNSRPRNAMDKNLKMRLVNPDSAFFQGGAK